jgi:uncharacterized protein DUF4333
MAVGCGKTVIDDGKAEAFLKDGFQKNFGVTLDSADCPSGVDVKANTTFDCTVAYGDKSGTVTMKILNDNADVKPIKFTQNK